MQYGRTMMTTTIVTALLVTAPFTARAADMTDKAKSATQEADPAARRLAAFRDAVSCQRRQNPTRIYGWQLRVARSCWGHPARVARGQGQRAVDQDKRRTATDQGVSK